MPPTKKVGKTDAMVQSILAAPEQRLEIPYFEAEQYERLMRAATQFNKLPEGKCLRLERTWKEGKAWIVLEDLPAWKTTTLEPIAVPNQLRQPSDVVESLRSREDLRIRQAEMNRALRLIEALVQEARRRGYAAKPTPQPQRDRSGYPTKEEPGHFTVAIGTDVYRLTISQENGRVPHVPTKAEEAQARRGWPPPKYDTVLTPRLRITIEGNEAPFRQSVWADKPDRPVDDSLVQILHEIELRHARAEDERVQAERQRQERQRQWELARNRAIDQLIDSHRACVLRTQLERWELVARLEAYISAVEAHLDAHPELREDAASWLAWMREYCTRTNPLSADFVMPDDPKPSAETLAPFMKGWNPYGPW